MGIVGQRRWLMGAGALMLAVLAYTLGLERLSGAFADDKTARAAGAENRTVSFLKEVRPILAQHCFRCHGPDEDTRQGKLRLDLKDKALAAREGKHVIAPGDPEGSLAWERMTTDDDDERMPPAGKAEPLTEKQIATVKTWIEQGARWEDHWSFLPPKKPAIPAVPDKKWVRDPLDAFVLARLDREHLKPEAEATREAWLRRASFDLTGLPPTPAEIDEFLADKRADAYETRADRLLKSKRYGERQAQEWLDLARYADTSGYQIDMPREIWKWREWVINAFNANMPFDQFAIEQLAGDLLPNATLAQKVATGFNRNHPTNSEAGEEEDEYRSAYVIDRVNTTATVFLGVTLACAQCHDHKYDPISQRDYYSFYSFFNNIKERDSEHINPRPSIPVPNPDQEPRLADLKARIDALKQRLERDDSPTDAAQKEWERKTLARLAKPIAWTTAPLAGMLSRGGSQLKPLDDGSILSTGPAPVKDTYDIMVLPGKRRITALRLELLPDDSAPAKALGRASDGRFTLSAIEIRNTTFSESQEPPLVYVSRAEADINQKPKEDPAAYDMMPGTIESAIVVEPVGGAASGNRPFGGWSIVDDERKKPHEAIFLPLEPIATNEASMLRFSLHQMSPIKFRSLIARFRISYTEDERIRELMLPAQSKLWNSIGPFPAQDVLKAYATAFEPEKDLTSEPLDLKKSLHEGRPPARGGQGRHRETGAGGHTAKPAGDKAAPKKEEPSPDKGTAAPAGGAPAGVASGTAPGDGKPRPRKVPAKGRPRSPSRWPNRGPKGPRRPRATPPGPRRSPLLKRRRTARGRRSARRRRNRRDQSGAQGRRGQAQAREDDLGRATDVARRHRRTPPGCQLRLLPHPQDRVDAPAHRDGANRRAGRLPDVGQRRAGTDLAPAGARGAPQGGRRQADGRGNGPDAKDQDDKEEPAAPEINDANSDEAIGRGRNNPERKFRIGLRQGENEIVVKVVFGDGANPNGRRVPPAGGAMGGGPPGGGMFTFNITPEGDDVLTHEVVTALRLEALQPAAAEPAAAASPSARAPASAADPSPSRTSSNAASGQAPKPSANPSGEKPWAPKDASALKLGPSTRDAREVPASSAAHEAKASTKPAPPMKVSLVGEKSAPLKSDEEENKLSPSERRKKVLREFYRSHIDPVGRIVAEELSKLKDEEKLVKQRLPKTLVMEELEKPRQAYVFKRGLYKNRGENVEPATPAVLPPMAKGAPRNRLGLAQWLVSGQNPLTARVLVNRIWTAVFRNRDRPDGRGLRHPRRAPDAPRAPRLSRHRAGRRQVGPEEASQAHRALGDLSPGVDGFEGQARSRPGEPPPRPRPAAPPDRRDGPRQRAGRLGAPVREDRRRERQAGAAQGRLEDGRGLRVRAYRRDRDEKQYRRALYVYWKRGSPYPSMLNFDAVKRDSCTVTRATTTTPVQALTLLNDPVYVECAKMLGQRMLKDREALRRARDLKKPEEDAKRLAYGFRLCTSRPPSEQESRILPQAPRRPARTLQGRRRRGEEAPRRGRRQGRRDARRRRGGGMGVRRQRVDQSRRHDPPLIAR